MIAAEVLKSFTGKNVLVTGGTGLIGRQVVSMLCDAGAHVKIVSLDAIAVHDKAAHLRKDLTSFEICKEVSKDMDFVFHLAGVQGTVQTSSAKMASHFVPTLMLNTNMLEACRLNKVRKVVYTSSIGAYADREILKESEESLTSSPMAFAGWAKRMAEQQIYAYRVQYGTENFAIVRLSIVYGPGDNFDPETALVIPALICRIFRKDNPVTVWGDGSVVRDFVFSRDAAEGIILALHYGTGGRFVNIGSGKGYSIREIVETLNSFITFNYEFDTTKPSGSHKRIMDITLARDMILYNPTTSLIDGLKQTWKWFVSHPDEYLKKVNYFAIEMES